MDTENYLYYSSEAKKQLATFAYYLSYLRNEVVEDKGFSLTLENIELIGERINEIQQNLEAEEERMQEKKEASKTPEEKEMEENIKKIKRIYQEETGQPLLLSDKDVMENVRGEIQKLKEQRNTYQAPEVSWDVLVDENKDNWVKKMREKAEQIQREKY